MNYEEKYKQAFERAKERYSACSAPALLEYIFPELKENEDERIRKAIICGMNALKENRKSETFATIPIDDCIDWLEKQREQKTIDNDGPKFHPGDWIIDNEYGEFLKVTKADANSYEITTQDGEALGGILKEDVECNHRLWTIEDAKDGDVLATSAGAFIYNGNNGGGSCPGSYCGINTLGDFQIGIESHWTGKNVYPATKEQRELLFQKMKEFGYKWDSEKKELKTIEQKPVNNVESKFNEGDWVVYDHRPYQVVELPKEGYINLGLRRNGKVEFAPSPYCRHWSIQDAKDGDVLASELSGSIFLFRGIKDNKIDFYCDYDTELEWPEHRFGINDTDQHYGSVEESQDIHPATKEQRDLLFAKMKEAGWEWDNEKKELKKFEPKFNVDDWIVTDDSFGKIVRHVDEINFNIIREGYVVSDENGLIYDISFDSEHKWHKWTIKDAEDGDVLSGEIDGDKYIFSFKKLNGRWIETQGVCYCDTTGECIENARFCNHYQDFFKPASKEECDVLLLNTVNHQLK